jgi:hypothetical protein
MKKFIVMIFCGIAALLTAEEVNLIKNADFAKMYGKNPAGFQVVVAPESKLEVLADEEVENGKILKLVKAEEKACMLVQRDLQMDADKTYTFSCEVKSADAGKGMVYVEWRTKLADGKYQHKSINAVPFEPADEWIEYSFEVPARDAKAEKSYIVFVGIENSVEFRNLKLVVNE